MIPAQTRPMQSLQRAPDGYLWTHAQTKYRILQLMQICLLVNISLHTSFLLHWSGVNNQQGNSHARHADACIQHSNLYC